LVMALETPLNLVVTVADLLGLDNALLSLRDRLREAYGRREPAHYVPVDGIVPFIQESSRQFDLAIVTTRNRKDTVAFIQQFGLKDYFKSVVTHEDVKRLKPHSEPIIRAAKELGYSPRQCILVGDTTVDIRAGKKAGTLTVGVLCGFGERPELDRLEPDLVVGTTSELAKHLPRSRQPWCENW
jgi:HAD superfamily hydrolase (TIGR01509 family)